MSSSIFTLTRPGALRAACILPLVLLPLTAASLPTARPEEVGLSTERLQRIHEMIMRHVEARTFRAPSRWWRGAGGWSTSKLTGLMDIEAKKPMTKDALFRLASSTKPITATAILMLMEEGKLKLTDPVAKYIPEFRNSKVAWRRCAALCPMSDGRPAAGRLLHGARESRHHHHRPADAYVRPGSGGLDQCGFSGVAEGPQATDTLADFIPRLGALRSISSPARSGGTAAWPGSTRWAALSRSLPG